MSIRNLISLFLVCSAFSALQAKISFNHEVKPILSDRCFHCHGPDSKNQTSDFRLDTFENATADLKGTRGIVPKNPEASEVIARIFSHDPDEMMPPPDSNRVISDREREILKQWISEGAKYDTHWSFKLLPDEVEVPKTEADSTNPIDHFIAEKLAVAEIKPAASISGEKWLRRVSFDLTGLPPTPEALDTFLAETDSPELRAKTVDALLASDRSAERLTSEWLDVARYSDTYGYQVDRPRTVWPYRDWVLRAFQSNKPVDDFITEQLAGDLLPDATREHILATTFLRLHPQKVEGGSVPEEFRVEYVADRIHTVGTAFLGLTFECCRCHDHKYDPLPTKEYYEMGAYFSNIDESGLYSYFTGSVPTPTLELPNESQAKARAEARKEVEAKEKALKDVIAKRRAAAKSEVNTDTEKTTEKDDDSRLVQPISHIRFDRRNGNSFTNEVAGVKDTTTTGNNTNGPGKIGQAIYLTGDDVVKFSQGNFTRWQPFSIGLWVYTPDEKDRAVIFRRSKAWTDAASRGYELLLLDGKLSAALVHFEPGNSLRVTTVDSFPIETWQHVTVTYDGSSRASGLQIYIDGKPAKTEMIRDALTREITGGGDDFFAIGQRMRDRGFKSGRVDEVKLFDRQLLAADVKQLVDASVDLSPEEKQLQQIAHHDEAVRKAQEELTQARKKLAGIEQKISEIMVMKEMPQRREDFILNRGIYTDRGESVLPGTPAVLPTMKTSAPGKERLDLAHWLTTKNHPLTARVTVNRYWQMMFGTGLVSTSEDFGSQGKPPSHPDLLDWLARDFIEHDWDLRHLLRQMALSKTYAQSTEVDPAIREKDPENVLLGRAPARRLTAEMIRDNALALSGLLVDQFGGGSVKPYELSASFKPSKPDGGNRVYRRSVYTYWQRTAPAPVMMTFNASKRDVCRVKREVTASPLQALVLMNDPQIIEACRVLAAKLAGLEDAALVEQAFRLVTSRLPTEKEAGILQALLKDQLENFGQDEAAAKKLGAVGNAPPDKTHPPARVAAAAVVINAMMNLDEAVMFR